MASKRGNRRRKKSKGPGRAPQEPVVQQFKAGPLRVVQAGANVEFSVDSDHPDYAALREWQQQMADGIPDRALEVRRQIAELAAPLHAFDVIFALWLYFGRAQPGTMLPIGEGGGEWMAEYVAHVLLDRDDAEPTREASDREAVEGADPEKFADLVREIVPWLPVWFTHRQRDAGKDDIDPWLELRSRLYMHRIFLRSFAYEQQERQTLHDLFDDFSEDLRRLAGFDVNQALSLMESIVALPMKGAAERDEASRQAAAEIEREVQALRAGDSVSGDLSPELLAMFTAMHPRRAARAIRLWAASWTWHGHGREAAFTVAELAEDAGVDETAAQRFLDAFSVSFGARLDRERWAQDPRRAFGGEFEVMREHPIIADGHDRYLPCSSQSLFYGLRDTLTDALKSDTRAFKRFQRQRAQTLERRAIAALRAALDADWSHTGVKYWIERDGEPPEEGEADGILRIESLIVLVEAKAGTLHPSARRAAPDRLHKGLDELVVEAAGQLGRSAHALVDGAATRVMSADGKPLELDTDGVARVLRIAVTLEDLSAVAPAAWRLQQAGVLPEDETAPWIVGIHELELICELSERPVHLVHYVLRRLRGNRQRLWAIDEMDFFMRHLDPGLFFDDDEVPPDGIELDNHTNALDAWWYGRLGVAEPAKRPKPKLDTATRQLLEDIDRLDGKMDIEAQLMLLELSGKARKDLLRMMRDAKAKTARDGEVHDATLIVAEDFGITVYAVPFAGRRELGKDLAAYGAFKSEQLDLRRWLGLGFVDGGPHRLDTLVVMLEPDRLKD